MGCTPSTPAAEAPTPAPAGRNREEGRGHRGARTAAGAPEPVPPSPAASVSSDRKGFRSQLIKKSQRAWYDTYIKETTLGHGMTGKVYRIKDKNTGERYALKMMDASKVNPELLQDLVNEIELLQSLDHPNVIKLHEYFYDGDTVMESSNLFLVMELCEGGELFDRLHMQAHSHYSEAKAAAIVTMMLNAIAYIHSKGVSHRDLKLENFLFESRADDSNLKLIDFGLSARYTATGGVHRMTTMVGTPYYIAPEVLSAGRGGYTPACDMWSLGVITYMLLSGTPPFKGRHDADVLASVKRGKYNLSGRRWEHVSEGAKNFVRRLLVYRPASRATAAEALLDPWIAKHKRSRDRKAPPAEMLDEELVGNLRAFTRFSALKRAALEAIAFQVAAPKLANLRSVFLDMDKDRTGLIKLEEMQEVLVSRAGMAPGEVQDIFARLDQDGQETISYSEFLAATLSKRFYMREGRIRSAFEKLDVDNTGYITPENLREILGDDFTPERVAAMISEADALGDGRISYKEFLALFRDQTSATILPGGTPTPRSGGAAAEADVGFGGQYLDDMGLGDRFASEGGASALEGGPSEHPAALAAVEEVDEISTLPSGSTALGEAQPPSLGLPGATPVAPPPAGGAGGYGGGADADAYAYLAAEPLYTGYDDAYARTAADDIHLYVGEYAEDEEAARHARRAARREKRRRERAAEKAAAQAAAAAQGSASGSESDSEEEEEEEEVSGRRRGRRRRDHHRAMGYTQHKSESGDEEEGEEAVAARRRRRRERHTAPRSREAAVGGSVIVMSNPQRRGVERGHKRSARRHK